MYNIKLVINTDREPIYDAIPVQDTLIRLVTSIRYVLNTCAIFEASATTTPQGLNLENGSSFDGGSDLIGFYSCALTRAREKLSDSTYVVFLTDQSYDNTWFSQFDDNRNIVVRIDNWHLYTNANKVYPIAYEIACAFLRIEMGIGNSSPLNHLWHVKPRGCVNDLCLDEQEVNLKLRTADICPSCRAKVHPDLLPKLSTFIQFFELIRFNIINPASVTYPNVFIYDIKIWLDDVDSQFTPLEKAIYLFFLVHADGVAVSSLKDYEMEILETYQRFRPSGTLKTVQKLTNYRDNSFMENVSRLNAKLSNILHKQNASAYIIQKSNDGKMMIKCIRPSNCV